MSTREAVFLSYASQDSEAAGRICAALRGAGIEVWFDQSELRGGDAWDQSIRRRIKECALFMPILSANTQIRSEGYFRLEWHLAEQRSLLIARGRPFIVPVAVDAISDRDALVPEAFLAVQWMKVPSGDVPPAFCVHVKKLLAGSDGEGVPAAPESGRSISVRNPPAKSRRWGAWVAAAVVCAALAGWWRWDRGEPLGAGAPAIPETRQLVANAWGQLNKTELGPEELEIADGYCKRAAQLDPSDAEVWATWSQVDSWYVYYNFDATKERQDAARSKAERALRLAPGSYDALLAQACYLVRGATLGTGSGKASTFAPEALEILQRLLREQPGEPRALFALGILERNLGHPDEARADFVLLARNPRCAATAWSEYAWVSFLSGAYRAVDAPLARSIAIQPFYGNLGLKVLNSLSWHGDLAAAKAAMDKIPVSVMQTDFGVGLACGVYEWMRRPEDWLKFLRSVPQDWLQSVGTDGPIAWPTGQALQEEGRLEAARFEWQAGLKLVEARLADQPTSARLLQWKGILLTHLGQYAEAEKSLQLAGDVSGEQDWRDLFELKAAEGQLDTAMVLLQDKLAPTLTAADLRLEPFFDPLRADPRFKALLARFEADPTRSPNAPQR